jgi:hypothetical protein
MATLRLGDIAPDFTEKQQWEINFHEWIGDSWCVLFHIPPISRPFVLLNWELLQIIISLKKKYKSNCIKCGWIRVAYKMD